MMEERYHATTQKRFYPYMSNVNKTLQWRQNLSAHLRRSLMCYGTYSCLLANTLEMERSLKTEDFCIR